MGEQSVRQTARRAALDAQATMRAQRAERERRLSVLGVAVMVAVGERDARVAACERRAGDALRTMTDREGLTVREAIDWCGPNLTVREAARLRGLGGSQVADDGKAGDGEPVAGPVAGPSVALPATVSADGAPRVAG
jgi:hypothetical protein